MPFRPKVKNPDFSRLKSTLAQIGIGKGGKDNALYETLQNLIDWLQDFKGNTEKDILDLNESINEVNTTVNVVAGTQTGYPPQLGHTNV